MKNTTTLLISCPDRKGIVATVANFLYKHGANILHADQHQDSELNLFFQRIEWDLNGFNLNEKDFKKKFSEIAKEFNMRWQLYYSNDLVKIAIFVSNEDHCLADLLFRYKNGEINCEIPLVIGNHKDAQNLVEFYGIPFYEIPVSKSDKSIGEERALKMLVENKIDLVILARYMQILSAEFIKDLNKPIINIHHSFLPAFVGAKPYHQAYARGVKIIGATSHYVSPDLD
ncbi:formyltetrahydrofolate deformylase, partial [Candidatus Gottesmanbacteria bacterium]|nr:formyltetrahydrofolate deformylase [Candidatus Gottesmanbacteria bacterium]